LGLNVELNELKRYDDEEDEAMKHNEDVDIA
jgi:hypothetical protein